MKDRIRSVEMIRGLAMLGVIGIHTGSLALTYPQASSGLIALLEIVSRFSVPIFFFISAFSLFRQYPIEQPLDLKRFFQRRFSRVLLHYVAGSILYMLHYSWTTGDFSIWFPILIYQFFFFGMASYQLYFLVILLWFYLLFPLWRLWVRRILQQPLLWLLPLLAAQILFNYYSSYLLKPDLPNFYANLGIQYRMSWWPLHYLFLFLLGGAMASGYERSLALLRRYERPVFWLLLLSLALLLSHFYYLLLVRHASLVQAVNTAHQLSPAGILYSIMAPLYLMTRLEKPLPELLQKTLCLVGAYSYSIFWVHPMFLHYLHEGILAIGWEMTTPVTLFVYLATTLLSLGLAAGVTAIRKKRSVPAAPTS